jgi:hypothetical protein
LNSGAASDTSALRIAAVVKECLARQCNLESEKLPEELATAISQSVAGSAVEEYESRFRAGLSMVRSAQSRPGTTHQLISELMLLCWFLVDGFF